MKPLLNFTTDSFSFRLYQDTIIEKEMIQEFSKDQSTQEFLIDFWNYILETKEDLESGIEPQRYTNIIYHENEPIGLITFFDLENELIFSHGIKPSQRGNRFSSRVKKEVFEHVFKNMPTISKITTYIDVTNSKNLNSLKKLTYDEIETITDEEQGKTFYKVTHLNPYCEEKLEGITRK